MLETWDARHKRGKETVDAKPLRAGQKFCTVQADIRFASEPTELAAESPVVATKATEGRSDGDEALCLESLVDTEMPSVIDLAQPPCMRVAMAANCDVHSTTGPADEDPCTDSGTEACADAHCELGNVGASSSSRCERCNPKEDACIAQPSSKFPVSQGVLEVQTNELNDGSFHAALGDVRFDEYVAVDSNVETCGPLLDSEIVQMVRPHDCIPENDDDDDDIGNEPPPRAADGAHNVENERLLECVLEDMERLAGCREVPILGDFNGHISELDGYTDVNGKLLIQLIKSDHNRLRLDLSKAYHREPNTERRATPTRYLPGNALQTVAEQFEASPKSEEAKTYEEYVSELCRIMEMHKLVSAQDLHATTENPGGSKKLPQHGMHGGKQIAPIVEQSKRRTLYKLTSPGSATFSSSATCRP
ncbi:hypothetical protein HPB51_005209 [Rhipicephalus microplus]|uniref:Tick transposon n=1 Tax=Rhipicephalus microplus TaxID=6941 RepID=A0A9J6E5P1_RHIMP|nr:hypothetical protein HPB51_005209 [Rhipicephalus microplus]